MNHIWKLIFVLVPRSSLLSRPPPVQSDAQNEACLHVVSVRSLVVSKLQQICIKSWHASVEGKLMHNMAWAWRVLCCLCERANEIFEGNIRRGSAQSLVAHNHAMSISRCVLASHGE